MITRISQIDVDRLSAASLPYIRNVGRNIQSAQQEIFDGIDTGLSQKAKDGFSALLSDSMLAAHLSGRFRSMTNFAKHSRTTKRLSLYDDAVRFVQERAKLSPDKIDYLRKKYGDTAVDVTTRGLDTEMEKIAQKATGEIVKQGLHVKDAKKLLQDMLESAGLSGTSPHLLEALVRTQIQIAYSAGQWNANQDPVINQALWGYEYVTAMDDRVRPEHAILEGVKLPKDDPRWLQIWPPNGWNCRCQIIEIWKDDAANMKRLIEPERIDIDPLWQFNPGRMFLEPVFS